MKLLVISLAGIGDTLIATPLIHELRLNFPDARLDTLVLWPGSKDLLAGNPWLNTVHQANFFQMGQLAALRYLLRLRREQYDVSINTHPQSKIHYRLTAWLIGARRRLSHLYHNSGLWDNVLINAAVPQDYTIHSVENNLRLLRLLGKTPQLREHAFELFLTPEEQAQAEHYATDFKQSRCCLIGLHVGSGKTKNLSLKRWPVPNWIALIQRVLEGLPDVTVLLFGGPEEKQDNEQILSEVADARVVTPPTRSIREAAALLAHCDAFISVDNALMHCAAAMKVSRQIVIESVTFGPTLEPYVRPYRLVKNPAVHGRNLEYYRYDGRDIRGTREELIRCMMAVTPQAVFQTLMEALEEKEGASG